MTASINTDAGEVKAELKTVRIVYSVDGNTETGLDMVPAGNGTWTASIPAQDSGARVEFYIWVEDSNGNVTTGAVSSASTLVEGIADADDPTDAVPDNADLINISANYDSEHLYFSFDVQGMVDGGTLDPPNLILYFVKITNPDQESGEGLNTGKLFAYSPFFKMEFHDIYPIYPPFPGKSSDCECTCTQKEIMEYRKKTGMYYFDFKKYSAEEECKCIYEYAADCTLLHAEPTAEVTDGKFVGSFKRAALGDNPSGYLRLMALTAVNKSIDSFMPVPLNCTNFLTLYTSSYSYIVK